MLISVIDFFTRSICIRLLLTAHVKFLIEDWTLPRRKDL